ncbi:hypothetical protein [Salipiger mangrovisoli]|uniref:Uncharacterized protein n=1 Tax=Salipiger mangrovisoli TaxID=2865933 RepID=A0ABR9X3V6_9RHOB|nr:hypothetical protein [Salipiger mangrovisoli]MBE9638191.1 hypothetical protein [Salipiger mangrovisoli]
MARTGAWIVRAGIAALLVLAGCGSSELPLPVAQEVSTVPLDRALYEGDLVFGIAEEIDTAGRPLPFRAYMGLAPGGETRIAVRAAADLREIQSLLPTLLSGSVEPDCGLGLTLGLASAEAEGNAVRARGAVRAELFRCKGRGTAGERRGAHLWTQMVDFDALVGAGLRDDCVVFDLRDLALDPRGIVGGLGTLLGLTEKVRRALLEEGNAALRAAPVCPDMPEALSLLSPEFSSGGAIEIGDGGLGAALVGTVASDAARIVALLALWQRKGLLPQGGEEPVGSDELRLRLEGSLGEQAPPVPYRLDLRMWPQSPTRIGLAAMLDLRAVQQQLPDLAEGAVLVDDCRARVSVENIEATAQEATVVVLARLDARSFTCDRVGDSAWQRGALEQREQVDVRAEVSASVVRNCAVFHLVDLARDPPLPLVSQGRQGARTEAARTLFIDAVDLLLKARPLCPELPEELRMLDPRFDEGAPQEIGDGGLGIHLAGSVDLSAATIIALLKLLQERGVLPPRP